MRFAGLLQGHLTAGTRPATASGEPWKFSTFAEEVQSSREEQDFVSPRSVSNWCKGKAVPSEIEPILRALFGPEGSARHAKARKALREAFQAACLEKAGAIVAGAKRDPAGGRWVVEDEQFTLDRTVRPSDRRAAADPLRGQMQAAIAAAARDLAGPAGRLANSPTWGALGASAAALHAIATGAAARMPDRLGELYALLLRLGQFLDTDTRVQRDPGCADDPLGPDLHGALSHLIRLAAPWLRGFPTVAAWDEAAGRTLVRADLFQPARDFNRIAREQRAIPERDADEIARLADAADAEGFQGRKAGARAVGDVQNLILAGAEAAAHPASDPAAPPLHVRRALAALEAGRAEVERVAETLPPDLRHALLAIVADAGRAGAPGEDAGRTSVPVPEDVEGQARDLIMAGQAPPAAWRPFIRKLDFRDAALTTLELLTDLTALRSLNLRRTQLSGTAPLAVLTGLQFLDLSGTRVSDTAPLAALTGLRSLYLLATQVSDTTPLAALTGLQSLHLSDTPVSDAAPLAALTGLKSLDLSGTQVSDAAPLAALAGLQSLDLADTPVSDATLLAGLTKLQFLSLMNTQVSATAPLAALTGLQFLDLSYTQVSDIAPLAALTGLQSLDLSYTQVSDIAPLAALTGLQSLDLMNTQVIDTAPLAALTGLRSLDLRHTNVGDLSPLSELQAQIKHDLSETEKAQPRRTKPA